MSWKDAMQRAHEVLNYVGLGEARYRRVDSYSTGMKQRLKIAAAIVHDPRLVILDEPTNGMDPAGRGEVLELARDLSHNKGMSLLCSSHLLPDIAAVLRPRPRPRPWPTSGAGRAGRPDARPEPDARRAGQGGQRRLRGASRRGRLPGRAEGRFPPGRAARGGHAGGRLAGRDGVGRAGAI